MSLRAIASTCCAVLVMTAAVAAAAPPTKDGVLATLKAWSEAQNKGDFAAYAALYDDTFVGIKRTSAGTEQTYDLARWKTDRAKMFKGPQKVAVERPKVTIRGDRAIVAFIQRWQGKTYADHGTKVLRLRAAGGGLKIVREELQWSAPGWKDDPSAEVDARALASPITVRLRATPPKELEGCGSVTYTLELTDTNGKKLNTDIGTGVVMIESNAPVVHEPQKGDPMFEVGAWCAGGADKYQIKSSGDALIVRYMGEDEGGESGDKPTWDTKLTVRLPRKAKLQ